jgi:dihydropyrimidinase
MYDVGLVNGNVYIEGHFYNKNVYIKSEKIVKITEKLESAKQLVDCSGKKILPGFIDPHVHMALNLGEFSSVDDFESGSKAAVYGGVTTIIDFLDPINHQSDFRDVFDRRLSLAKKTCIDYSFHLTLGNFKKVEEIPELLSQAYNKGLNSVKVFTTYSESNRKCPDAVIAAILKTDMLLMSHSENDDLVDPCHADVSTFENSRPVLAEISQVAKLAQMAAFERGCLYIVHTSAGSTVEMMAKRFGDLLGKRIFLESCPQYFYLTRGLFKGDQGRKYLLAPPLRSESEQDKLRKNLHHVSTIATDHCPFMAGQKMKYSEARQVPKGIGGIEYSFLLMYNLYGDEIIDHFTCRPAKIFGLSQKGCIDIGMDADLVIFDERGLTPVDSGHSTCDYSPYEGIELKGAIESTMVRGRFVLENGLFNGGEGKFIRRGYCESDHQCTCL